MSPMVRVLAAVAGLTLAACGGSGYGSSTDVTNPSVVGVYALKSVNDTTLPYPEDGGSLGQGFIDAGSLTVTATGTWSETNSYHTVLNGQSTPGTSTDTGSYTLSGSTFALHHDQNGTNDTAIFSGGNTLTYTNSGRKYIYVKK